MSLGFNFTAMLKQLEDQDLPKEYAASKTLQVYRENMRAFEDVIRVLSQAGQSGPGAVVVAASGNDSRRQASPDFVIDVTLPAATTNIISVGALMPDGGGFKAAPFSNINPILAAPGYDIVSAQRGGGLTAMNGTSMACPHVAGLAALWWEETLATNGRVNAEIVQNRLRARAMQLETLAPADRGEGMPVAPKKRRPVS
jgi:subtilisin family serine protease